MYIINDMKSLSLLYCLKWLAHIQSLPHGRRKWQPTPVFLPGESHGQRSLVLSIGSHRVGDNWSDLACMHALEKEMATHSSILAWRIPGTEEPGGLLSMGSHRVGYDWSDLAAAAAVHGSSWNLKFCAYFTCPWTECVRIIDSCDRLQVCNFKIPGICFIFWFVSPLFYWSKVCHETFTVTFKFH